jgi:hypothetical protein
VLISIIVGLGVTHLLKAVGRAINHPDAQRLFWVHSLWVVATLVQLVYFWWFQLGYRVVEDWSGATYAFVVCYAIALYLQCVIIVPHEPEEDYRAYFFARQKWIFGIILAVWMIDAVDTVMKPAGLESVLENPLARVGHYVVYAVLFGIAMFTRRVWYHGILVVVLLINLILALLFVGEAGA